MHIFFLQVISMYRRIIHTHFTHFTWLLFFNRRDFEEVRGSGSNQNHTSRGSDGPNMALSNKFAALRNQLLVKVKKKGINSKFPADGLCTKMSGYQRLPTSGTFLCRGQGTYPRSRRTTLTLYIRILFIHNSHSVLKKPDIISIVYRVAERHQKLRKPFIMISQLKIFIDNTRNIAFNYFEICVLRYVLIIVFRVRSDCCGFSLGALFNRNIICKLVLQFPFQMRADKLAALI